MIIEPGGNSLTLAAQIIIIITFFFFSWPANLLIRYFVTILDPV